MTFTPVQILAIQHIADRARRHDEQNFGYVEHETMLAIQELMRMIELPQEIQSPAASTSIPDAKDRMGNDLLDAPRVKLGK